MGGARGLIMFALLSTLALTSVARTRGRDTGFLDRAIKAGSVSYRYQVYVPAEWSKKKKWPVILFLHGAGERRDDGLIQTEVGIGTAIRRHADRVPAVVVFPQCLKDRWWPEPEMQAQALKALDEAIKEFNGDAERIYLTGISMGGYGTWSIAANNPTRFAALAPVCGGVRTPPRVAIPAGTPEANATGDPYKAVARKVGSTPAWVFHGAADPVVPVSESQKMVEALKASGG
ncbi:MAG TPA: prolyl oligopeptidase family serine peptidase, partial [Blastocatellia bacterium]|nr:prolyl oligopeptidase family serine peptidase [Blastocatellia bacterium]